MGIELLKNLTEDDYEQLTIILEDTWSILNALMSRIGELIIQNS